MATAANTAIDPGRLYRAWQSFAPADDGPVVRKGDVLRGSDSRVQKHPEMWVDHERVLPAEQPTEFDHVIEQIDQRNALREAEELEEARANRIKLEAPTIRVYRATRDVLVLRYHGRPTTIVRGSTVLEGDWLLHDHGDAFKPVDR